MRWLIWIFPALWLVSSDSLSVRPSDPIRAKKRIWAPGTGWGMTSGAIGGRFELVDTLRVSVTSDVTADARVGVYRYRYVVRNERGSFGVLNWFELLGVTGSTDSVTSPPHWKFLGVRSGRRPSLVWSAELGNPPPGWTFQKDLLYPSEFAIQPGDSLAGFGFKSSSPPGAIRYRVRPFEPLKGMEGIEDLIPEIPVRAEGEAYGPDSTRED